jgi:serine/threonine protein kinase
MNLILHIGIEKTGSSSIQAFLFENRKALENAGYGYIHTAGRVDHRDLAVAFMKHSRSDGYTRTHKIEGEEVRYAFCENVKKQLAGEVASLRNKGLHTCIISSEHLNSRFNDVIEIQGLASYLQSIFDDVHVVAYVRDQRKKFPSQFSTRIKTGGTLTFRTAFNNYLSSNNDFYDMSFLRWEDSFGSEALCLQLFDRKCFYRSDLIQDFLKISSIELDQKDLKFFKSDANSALSRNACKILRMMNFLLPGSGLRSVAVREILIKMLNHLPGKPWSLSSEQSELITKKYQDSNEEFRKKYFPDKDSLFDD